MIKPLARMTTTLSSLASQVRAITVCAAIALARNPGIAAIDA